MRKVKGQNQFTKLNVCPVRVQKPEKKNNKWDKIILTFSRVEERHVSSECKAQTNPEDNEF